MRVVYFAVGLTLTVFFLPNFLDVDLVWALLFLLLGFLIQYPYKMPPIGASNFLFCATLANVQMPVSVRRYPYAHFHHSAPLLLSWHYVHLSHGIPYLGTQIIPLLQH